MLLCFSLLIGPFRKSLQAFQFCVAIRCAVIKDARDEPGTHLQDHIAPQAPAATPISLPMAGRREYA